MEKKVTLINDGITENLDIGMIRENNIKITPQINSHTVNLFPSCSSYDSLSTAILKKYCPRAKIINIKISIKNDLFLIEQLRKALDWCIQQKIRLVNFSLAIINDYNARKITPIINHAYKNNLILIAAQGNQNTIAYPSVLSNVIGVKCDRKNLLKYDQFIFNPYPVDGIEIVANARQQIVDWQGNKSKTPVCNRLAAAVITATVHKILEKKPHLSLEAIKEKLYQMASNSFKIKYNPYLSKNIDWIDEAVLFDFNQDLENIRKINFRFKIPHIISINSDGFKAYEKVKQFIIHNDSNLTKIDTFIFNLNHRDDIQNEYLINSLLIIGHYYNKNIVLLDHQTHSLLPDQSIFPRQIKIWHPYIHSFYFDGQKKIKDFKIPLFTIYNFTDINHFSLADQLRSFFNSNGLVSQVILNSPLALLMGMEFIPFEKNHNKNILNQIKLLSSIYSPDILFYAINARDIKAEKIHHFNKNIEPIVRIIIVPDENTAINRFIEDNWGKKTICISLDHPQPDHPLQKNITYFYYQQQNLVEEIYEHILSLLENVKTGNLTLI